MTLRSPHPTPRDPRGTVKGSDKRIPFIFAGIVLCSFPFIGTSASNHFQAPSEAPGISRYSQDMGKESCLYSHQRFLGRKLRFAHVPGFNLNSIGTKRCSPAVQPIAGDILLLRDKLYRTANERAAIKPLHSPESYFITRLNPCPIFPTEIIAKITWDDFARLDQDVVVLPIVSDACACHLIPCFSWEATLESHSLYHWQQKAGAFQRLERC